MANDRFTQSEENNMSNVTNMDTKVRPGQSTEGSTTGMIESVTSKMPSMTYLNLAFGCMAASFLLKLMKKDDWAIFVGLWPASFLIMGNYNKMVKQHGSDSAQAA
ncbi:MAG TPA: hypothetical protein VM009_02240 [Terriglobales bacterium]|nr:hypothetical protein [Terriglobales bacterium]